MPAASFNELFGLGSHSPDANLEGWWPCMDNAANTTVLDYSGHGRNGTATQNTNSLHATGPNGWLTGAFNLNGTSDYLDLDVAASSLTDEPASFGLHFAPDNTTALQMLMQAGNTTGNFRYGLWYRADQAGDLIWAITTNSTTANAASSAGAASAGTWYSAGGVFASDTSRAAFLNGENKGTNSDSRTLSGINNLRVGISRYNSAGNQFFFDGKVAGVSAFSRALSDAEKLERYNGPEPINTVAPVVSGTETEGETLSCTTGTWALGGPFSGGTNGTITYTYQWTRSDDGSGTGEANISGATSSTYTLQSTDIGKYIRCRVRASNDGGYDSAADTYSNFTNIITGNILFKTYWKKPHRIIR